MGPVLPYSPAPPADRVGITRHGDGLDVTLPPRISTRGVFGLFLFAALAVACFACVISADGTARLGRGSFSLGRGVPGRVMAGVVGAAAIIGVAGILREARTWARLGVHGGTLICTAPTLLGTSRRTYPLADLADASLDRPEDHGGAWYLILHRRDGMQVPLLEDTVYHHEDLQRVAGVLSAAIRGPTDAEPVTPATIPITPSSSPAATAP